MRLSLPVSICVLLGSALSVQAQLSVTGSVDASQVTSGTLLFARFPVGTTSSTVAIGSDSRFGNATKLNGTDISTLTGVLKLTSGTPSNAAASDLISLWSGCASGTPLLSYNGTCVSVSGTGTVTSVALAAPATLFAVTGSPITGSGTLSLAFATGQTASQVYSTDASGNAGLRALTAAMLPAPTTSLIGGVKAYTAVTNQFLTSIDTTGTPVSAQPSFANLSGSVAVAQLPTSTQVWNTYTIPYTSVQTGATSNAVTVVSLTSRQIACGLVEKTTTAFAGTSISGLTVTVGDSNGTSTTYSSVAYNLLQTVSNTAAVFNNVVGAASFAGGTVQANFTSSGANLSALTAGSIQVSVCTVTLP